MEPVSSRPPLMSNQLYDILKFHALVVLPAVATLYFALASTWHLPYSAEVVGTITAIDTCLGVLLGISTKQYVNSEARFDGYMDVVENDESTNYRLNLNLEPQELAQKKEILFKVDRPQ